MSQPPVVPEILCTFSGCLASESGLVSLPSVTHARAVGWHIWTGETVGGTRQTVMLCPEHAGNQRTTRVGHPDWDEPLW